MEMILLFLIFLIVAGVVAGVVLRGALKGASAPAVPAVSTPEALHQTVTWLVREGQKIQAIKEIRQFTGLDLRSSKEIVDGVALGRDLWSHPAMFRFRPLPQELAPADATDLATRVRGLKAAGQTERAIFLVRGETGMDQHAAESFVQSL
ncbi:ribosomal protein L7/L12 [Sphaerisporangium corydalis]|uniref:Ribosomal protein L7/L12 n=1 Tax=Sphaerisporangium corydalis TaxID=1441875 RepID=A0ABV9EN59_9ACTN|nr:ribosomal protein L7/L12 [Sphaerisporangium corydalis]